jgi:hypothetical protein
MCGTVEFMCGTDVLHVRHSIYESSRFFHPKRECRCTLLHSSASQKAVVFIVTFLSNLVLEGVEVPGTSMNDCTDQEKISAKYEIRANVQQFMANGKLLLASTV